MRELFQALKQMKNVNFKVLIIGDGPLRNELENYELSKVSFLGQLPFEEVSEYLYCANALIFPTHNEGMPNVLIESMGRGLIPICSDIPP